jgi:hypothetical protein
MLRLARDSKAGATPELCTLAMIQTSARLPLYVGALYWLVIAIPFWVLACFPHHPGRAPTPTATVTPNTAPTFSPDSFPDLDRVNR